MLTPLERRVVDIVEAPLLHMGYTLVQVRLQDGAKRRILTLMAERKDGAAMTFDDCVEISTQASALLDVEDPITGAYQLEVSSPGIDRPLTRMVDFETYKGHEAKVETILPVNGRKRYRGVIMGVDDEAVSIKVDHETYALAFDNIRSAKLVLTEKLIKKTTA